MDTLNIVDLSYKPHSLSIIVRPWQYRGEKTLMSRVTGFFFYFFEGMAPQTSSEIVKMQMSL